MGHMAGEEGVSAFCSVEDCWAREPATQTQQTAMARIIFLMIASAVLDCREALEPEENSERGLRVSGGKRFQQSRRLVAIGFSVNDLAGIFREHERITHCESLHASQRFRRKPLQNTFR
jgi:hypothetical protein